MTIINPFKIRSFQVRYQRLLWSDSLRDSQDAGVKIPPRLCPVQLQHGGVQ